MKIFAILFFFLITGCAFTTTVPVVMKFPEAPASLTENCPALKTIEGEIVSIVDLHKVVVENYVEYYACAQKVDGWNEWYTKQKKIFEEVK